MAVPRARNPRRAQKTRAILPFICRYWGDLHDRDRFESQYARIIGRASAVKINILTYVNAGRSPASEWEPYPRSL